jgi:hypothetical protein
VLRSFDKHIDLVAFSPAWLAFEPGAFDEPRVWQLLARLRRRRPRFVPRRKRTDGYRGRRD